MVPDDCDGIVLLLSGGPDSVLLGEMAREIGRLTACLFVDYGQAARNMERRAAQWWADRWGVRLYEHLVVSEGLGALAATMGNGPSVIPHRNLLMLSLGAGLATELKCLEVWYGATASDRDAYPDCRGSFVAALNQALGDWPQVAAPLLNWPKSGVMDRLSKLGAPIPQTVSCYTPHLFEPCGKCYACEQRAQALGYLPGGSDERSRE